MIPNGYLMFEDENFIESSVAKLNALRKSGQFCDVRLQVTELYDIWVLFFELGKYTDYKDYLRIVEYSTGSWFFSVNNWIFVEMQYTNTDNKCKMQTWFMLITFRYT